MKILIAGYGFVGKAHHEVLKHYHDIEIYDPALKYKHFGVPDAIIVCVSTPQGSHGGCHMDNVYDVINTAPHHIPILIKSTISLEGWNMLTHTFPNKPLTFSPEFLRAATAEEDFKNTKQIMLGGDQHMFWADLFGEAMDVDIKISEPEELILAKYFRNAFLATKVAFFNQIHDLCQATGTDYGQVAAYVSEDSRIGESHTTVTEQRGFGGHCFPKDASAIINTGKKYKVDLSIIDDAVKYNLMIRKDNT
jgi:UDPglucose 6-dehydrogenase|tara:strand:- start:5233 stop:5982 length:750 start_codon:yes stop_codon:yes gene_type:complete